MIYTWAKILYMSGMCMWPLIEFGSLMECHASKNNLRVTIGNNGL